MLTQARTLLTGGSGLLGTHLRRLMPDLDAPDEHVFNVTDPAGMDAYLEGRGHTAIIHAAAFTSPPLIEQEPAKALEVNIAGTVNVVRLCMARGLRLVYISTDYVFRGDQGNYKEDDPLYPVNKYAWSKLGGECAVRLYDNALIIRTTFGPPAFPFPKAFVDQWTSRESVMVIAERIARVLQTDLTGVLHVGGPRKTVFDFARNLDPDKAIGALHRNDVNFHVPADTSLDTGRYRREVGQGDTS
ncbi:MAG: SDR family oxidoreductase [Candidatus Hydrogenedentota bacterium]